jgi:hypothetical protein
MIASGTLDEKRQVAYQSFLFIIMLVVYFLMLERVALILVMLDIGRRILTMTRASVAYSRS